MAYLRSFSVLLLLHTKKQSMQYLQPYKSVPTMQSWFLLRSPAVPLREVRRRPCKGQAAWRAAVLSVSYSFPPSITIRSFMGLCGAGRGTLAPNSGAMPGSSGRQGRAVLSQRKSVSSTYLYRLILPQRNAAGKQNIFSFGEQKSVQARNKFSDIARRKARLPGAAIFPCNFSTPKGDIRIFSVEKMRIL